MSDLIGKFFHIFSRDLIGENRNICFELSDLSIFSFIIIIYLRYTSVPIIYYYFERSQKLFSFEKYYFDRCDWSKKYFYEKYRNLLRQFLENYRNIRSLLKYIVLQLHKTTHSSLLHVSGTHTSLLHVSGTQSSHLGCGELLPELLHLFPQLPDDAGVGVLVHYRVVDDPLGAVGVAQCGQCLLVVVGRWAHRGDHGRLTVATKVVLSQNESQLV